MRRLTAERVVDGRCFKVTSEDVFGENFDFGCDYVCEGVVGCCWWDYEGNVWGCELR